MPAGDAAVQLHSTGHTASNICQMRLGALAFLVCERAVACSGRQGNIQNKFLLRETGVWIPSYCSETAPVAYKLNTHQSRHKMA